MTKKCLRCELEKDVSEFSKYNREKDSLHYYCKSCYKKYYRYPNNYYKPYLIKWRAEKGEVHRKYMRRYLKNRYDTDIKFRLDSSLGSSIWKCLKENKENKKLEKLVGYKLSDLRKHLESKFESWMSWNNYGKWEIDHIKPKILFNYQSSEDIEFKQCWALENLQPLKKSKNREKYNHF